MDQRNLPIGVMDSGSGGISVLREAVKVLPRESFIYYGDHGNAPYGVKEPEEIRALTWKVVSFLRERGIKALLVACNTASSAALEMLRSRLDIPVLGMEPAVKPALSRHENGVVVVMATQATLEQERFHHMLDSFHNPEWVVPLPCVGLMELVEAGHFRDKTVRDYLEKLFDPFGDRGIEAVVLGCTHYPFVKDAIRDILGDVTLVDGNEGTVHHLKHVLESQGLDTGRRTAGTVEYHSSSPDPGTLTFLKRLMEAP